ncbi:MAG: ATP synthase subunit I [Acidimicrobiales bacterium]
MADLAHATGTDAAGADTAAVSSPEPERVLALDLSRRALIVAPLFLLLGLALWGVDGLLSTLFALVLVVVNFLVAAGLSARAARVSLHALMAAVLVGYPLRLALIAAATFAVRNAGWFEPLPWGLTLIAAHLGLLVWEATRVSATLAHPTLRPRASQTAGQQAHSVSSPPAKTRSAKGL